MDRTENCPLEWCYMLLSFVRSAALVLFTDEEDWGAF